MLSLQSQQLYQTLLTAQEPLSAAQLGLRLGIVPQSVYRLTDALMSLGLMSKTSGRPSRFVAKPAEEAASLFLLAQNDWFSKKFRQNSVRSSGTIGQVPSFSFVQSRDELMRLSAEEINRTARSVDLLRSGREMPAEVMLAMAVFFPRIDSLVLLRNLAWSNESPVRIQTSILRSSGV